MDWEEFKEKVKRIINTYLRSYDIERFDDYIKIIVSNYIINYSKQDYEQLLKKVKNYEFKQFTLKSKNSYEAIIYVSPYASLAIDTIRYTDTINDDTNGISYNIDTLSDEMLYYLIKDFNSSKYAFTISLWNDFEYYGLSNNLLSALKEIMSLPYSIRITYKNTISDERLKSLASSHLFNATCSYDGLFRLDTDEDRIIGRYLAHYEEDKTRILRDAPKMLYKKDLIDQYNMAMASNDPLMQFIGYYHILEYFFKTIRTEKAKKLINEVEGLKNSSQENDKLKSEIISKLSTDFKNFLRVSEADSLLFTLEIYINLDKLKTRLEFISASSINHYKSNEVTFSKGSKVDLLSSNEELIYKNLKNRIYKTRNAIVHNKFNEDNEDNEDKKDKKDKNYIYNPFENEEELKKEIPLMRAIAEQIIINTAEEI